MKERFRTLLTGLCVVQAFSFGALLTGCQKAEDKQIAAETAAKPHSPEQEQNDGDTAKDSKSDATSHSDVK